MSRHSPGLSGTPGMLMPGTVCPKLNNIRCSHPVEIDIDQILAIIIG
jgi:hypothetical protein